MLHYLYSSLLKYREIWSFWHINYLFIYQNMKSRTPFSTFYCYVYIHKKKRKVSNLYNLLWFFSSFHQFFSILNFFVYIKVLIDIKADFLLLQHVLLLRLFVVWIWERVGAVVLIAADGRAVTIVIVRAGLADRACVLLEAGLKNVLQAFGAV